MDTIEIRYSAAGIANIEELNQLLDSAWRDADVAQQAKKLGIDLGTIAAERRDAIHVSRVGAGLNPLMTTIVVSFVVPVAKDVVIDLWKKVLLPWLEQRKGHGVLTEKKD